MFKIAKSSILSVLIASLTFGFLISIVTRYGYTTYNVLKIATTEQQGSNTIVLDGKKVVTLTTGSLYHPDRNGYFSGIPLKATESCVYTNFSLEKDFCDSTMFGNWVIVINWILWSLLLYIIIRLLPHKKLNRN